MTPDQFIDRLKKGAPAPAYLFLGQEPYQREALPEGVAGCGAAS